MRAYIVEAHGEWAIVCSNQHLDSRTILRRARIVGLMADTYNVIECGAEDGPIVQLNTQLYKGCFPEIP